MHEWFARIFFCTLLFLAGMGTGAEIERGSRSQPAAIKGDRLDIVEPVAPPFRLEGCLTESVDE